MRAKSFFLFFFLGIFLFLGFFKKTFSEGECKPLDLMFVIDTSTTMDNPGDDGVPKLQAVKNVLIGPQTGCSETSSCISGDNCCPPDCTDDNDSDCDGYIDVALRDVDRIGVVHFADGPTLDTSLTDPKSLSKEKIKDLSAGGSSDLAGGISYANGEIRSHGRGVPSAMIIITDGEPNSRTSVKKWADSARKDGIRIVIIGYKITDPNLKSFFQTDIVAPGDYFDVASQAELKHVLLDEVTPELLFCDVNPPDLVSAKRDPSGTIFARNPVKLEVTFSDNETSTDWGLDTIVLSWTKDPNWLEKNDIICDDLGLKPSATCKGEILGSALNENDTVFWKTKAKDGAGNESSAPSSGSYSFSVASVDIKINPGTSYEGFFVKDQENEIKFIITDPTSDPSNGINYYLRICSPPAEGSTNDTPLICTEASSEDKTSDDPILKQPPTNRCNWSGSSYVCTYKITPDDSWGDKAQVFFLPYSLANNFAEATKIVDVYEDVEPPSIAVSHSPDPVLDNDTVTLSITATDESGIYSMKICWRENGGDWTCHEWENPASSTQSIQIGPFPQGTIIEYYGEATDTAYNTGKTDTQSFTVFSSQCYDDERNYRGDLTHCNGGSGKCCKGICDTSYSCSLDDECSKETCSGTSWTCTSTNVGGNCCEGTNCDGCYPKTSCLNYGGGVGCEMRDYYCDNSGKCVYSVSKSYCDSCSGKILHNYECSGDKCKQIEIIDCSSSTNWDGDAIKCNCDCNCYDIEEKVGVSCGGKDVCTDGKDNDCDGVSDCYEPSCDNVAPAVSIFAYDSKGKFISDGGKVKEENTNKVRLDVDSVEQDPCNVEGGVNSVYDVKVFYKLNNGPWNLIIDCKDEDADGWCDDNPSLNISSFSVEIPEDGIPAGTTVYYKAEATDSVYNTAVDEGWFIVVSGECLGKPDLSSCAGGAGVCCGEVCNTKKECDLDDECSVDACDGIYWICVPANEGNSCSSGTWTKKRKITIDNSSSSETLRNFPIKVDVPYDSDMQIDFDDIRFTDENGAPLAFYKESVGQVLRVKYKGKYKCPSTHEELIDDYDFNTIYEKTLDYEIRSPRNVGTHFNWLYTTWLYVKKPGYWAFAIDGDEAVEVEVDGEIVASWYGGHGFCDCYDHNGSIYLKEGWHKLIVRHEENYYDDGVILYFKSPIDTQWKVFSKENLKGRGIILAYIPEDSKLKSKTFVQNGFSEIKGSTFWVKVPFVPASSTKTIYMYYGNPEATDASQLKETFEFSDDFEEGSLNGWSFSGDKGWEISTTHYEGSYGIQNEDIKDNQEACIFKNVTLPNGGEISFYWKVSSEKYYDFLKFYINGEEKAKISGEVSWHQRVFSLPSGTSEIKFCYTKDHCYDSGADTGYVDLIIIKPKPPLLSISISSNEETVNAIETGGCFSLPGYTETRGLASAYLDGCEKVDEGKCFEGKCMFKILDEKKDQCEDPLTSYNLLDYKCSGEDCTFTTSSNLICDYIPPVIGTLTAYDNSGKEIPNGGIVTRENASTIKFVSKNHFDEVSPIYYHKLEYRVKKPGQAFGPWTVLCACYDADGDGYCDSGSIDGGCSATTSITDFEFSTGPFDAGDEVEYRVTLMDTQFNEVSFTKSFSIQNSPPNKPEITENPLNAFGNVYPNSVECTPQEIYVVFKWKYNDPDGDKMKAARIQVSKNETFTDLLFDWTCYFPLSGEEAIESGEEAKLSTQDVSVLNCYDQDNNPVSIPPKFEWDKKYWWRIKVQDEPGSWSEWQKVDTGDNSLVFKTPRHPYPLVDFTWIPLSPESGESIKFNPQPPGGVSANPFPGGNLAQGTYYYMVTALFKKNGTFEETAPSKEVSCSVDGVSKKSCKISWIAIDGADQYRVYGRTSHSQSQYWDTTSTSFIDNGTGGTLGSPPPYPLCSCKTSTGEIRYFYCSTIPVDFPSECTSSITSISYYWDFRYKPSPGEDTSTEERPFYLGYSAPRDYLVRLEITQKEADGKEFKCFGEKFIHVGKIVIPYWKEIKPESTEKIE